MAASTYTVVQIDARPLVIIPGRAYTYGMANEFKKGDLVRFRGMPDLGVGKFQQYTSVDAHTGRPFRALVEMEGLDEGKVYCYNDHFDVGDLIPVVK